MPDTTYEEIGWWEKLYLMEWTLQTDTNWASPTTIDPKPVAGVYPTEPVWDFVTNKYRLKQATTKAFVNIYKTAEGTTGSAQTFKFSSPFVVASPAGAPELAAAVVLAEAAAEASSLPLVARKLITFASGNLDTA